MKRPMYDHLKSVAPPSVVSAGTMVDAVPDLQRILALPRRAPVICEPDKGTGRYLPSTQALVEVETAKFSRGARISCACRPRRIICGHDGSLTIFRVLPEGILPEPPVVTTRAAFLADNKTMGDVDTAKIVGSLQPGQELELPPAEGELGHPCITTLSPPQAWFLREAAQLGGAVGFLGVGSGKSIALLLASLLFTDSRLAVLLIEPKQRHHYRSEYLRLREHFRVSSIVSELEIRGSTVPGTTPCHLVSYSVLSRTENSDLLDDLKPDILLGDEFHRACGISAINRRVKRFLTARIKEREAAILRGERVRSRAVRLLGASGTLENKSVNDTQMICAFALGTGSPLPLDPHEAEMWSNVMDVAYQPDRKSHTAHALHRNFGRGLPDTDDLFTEPEKELRQGFQRWRAATLGIVTAAASDINAALYFSELDPPKIPSVVKAALAQVRESWLRPDGADLVEKIEQIACAKSVACGFYPYWAFPKHTCSCPSDRTPTRSSNWCVECSLIDDWYAKRRLFNKDLRAKLLSGELQLDSPKLCEEAAERGVSRETDVETYCDTCFQHGREARWPCKEPKHLPAWRVSSWVPWRDIRDKVEYEEKVRWIGHDLPEANDPKTHPGYFLARHAAEWGRKNKGVIWFQSTALGRKISELSGLPYFNGGPGGEERLRAEKGNRSIICSIPAHGAGTNGLQELFCDQLIVEMPASNASARGLEQVLGRLSRRGQRKDAVNTYAYLHVYEMKDALRKAIQQAEFNFAMTGIKQKILMTDIDVDEF